MENLIISGIYLKGFYGCRPNCGVKERFKKWFVWNMVGSVLFAWIKLCFRRLLWLKSASMLTGLWIYFQSHIYVYTWVFLNDTLTFVYDLPYFLPLELVAAFRIGDEEDEQLIFFIFIFNPPHGGRTDGMIHLQLFSCSMVRF